MGVESFINPEKIDTAFPIICRSSRSWNSSSWIWGSSYDNTSRTVANCCRAESYREASVVLEIMNDKNMLKNHIYIYIYIFERWSCWCLGAVWHWWTQWGRVTHMWVGKLITIGLDNGLSFGRLQAIIWTNAGILLIVPLGTNFSEILIEIQTFSFEKIRLNMSSAKWRPFVSTSLC